MSGSFFLNSATAGTSDLVLEAAPDTEVDTTVASPRLCAIQARNSNTKNVFAFHSATKHKKILCSTQVKNASFANSLPYRWRKSASLCPASTRATR